MPTITVRQFGYEELKKKLKRDDRILLLSCDSCAKQSNGLGGEQGLRSLADRLTADGFDVHHRELLSVACSPEQLKDRLQDEKIRRVFEDADVIIPLACQAGEERVGEVLPSMQLIRVTKTLGGGSYSPQTGARLTKARPDVRLDIDDAEGMPLAEAAKRLGMHSGSF